MPVPLKTRLLDPVTIPAHHGFDVVRLQLKPGVTLASARGLEDVIETTETVIAWFCQASVFDEGLSKGLVASANVMPITSYGLIDSTTIYLLKYEDGRYDIPRLCSGVDRREAVVRWLSVMRQKV